MKRRGKTARVKIRLLALTLVTVLAGCSHYWVSERLLDRYATLPPNVDRTRAVVDAVRVSDGRPALVHADSLRLEVETRGPLRQVRLTRSETIIGIVFLVLGTATTVTGAVLRSRPPDSDEAFAGLLLLLAGPPQVVVGVVKTAVGATDGEVEPGRRGFVHLE